jgi:hypothetical protein
LLVLVETRRIRPSDEGFTDIEVEMKTFDIFARQKGKDVIHSPGSQTVVAMGRGYPDGIAEG